MEVMRTALAEGVALAVTRTDKFKTGLFSVTLAAPLRSETATAYALTPEVLYRGSRNNPDIERLSAATDRLYGASLGPVMRQRGESQCVSFGCSFMDERYTLDGTALLEPAIALAGEVLLDPATENGIFRRDYVAGEGANLADRIHARINDKNEWAMFRLIEEMCAGEHYAVDKLGDAEEALRITPEELWSAYQRLLREARVVFYYGGSAEPERVEEAVRRHFGPLLTGRCTRTECQVLAEPKGPVRTVTDTMDVTQAKLAMGFRTGGVVMDSPDFPALMVCNTLYGGGTSSKLFLNVREKLSLCYYASSMLDKLKGLMAVSSGVECSDLDRAQEAILDQLEAVRAGDFTAEELQAAVRSVVNGLRSRPDSQGCLEDDRVTRLLSGAPPEDSAALIAAVEAVTAQDVVRVAQKLKLDTVYRLTGKEAATGG